MSDNKLNAAEVAKILVNILTAFYARHPDVERAIQIDGLLYGEPSQETHEMIWNAIQVDSITDPLPDDKKTL